MSDPRKTIQNIIDTLTDILNDNHEKNLDFPIEFTFMTILERVKFNLNSIQLLIEENYTKHDHAIGLLSRNLLSDFILSSYCLRFSDDEEDLKSKLYSLFYSDLKKVDNFLLLMKKGNLLTGKEYDEYKRKYATDNHIYKLINEEYSIIKPQSIPPISEIIKYFIESNHEDEWAHQVKISYATWILYSKYEHLGISSFELTRVESNEISAARLDLVIKKTIHLIAYSLQKIRNSETHYQKIMEILKIYYCA